MPRAHPCLAIAFCYFEALLRIGDVSKFETEEVRLKSMANLVKSTGFAEDYVDDFAQEAFDLLSQLSSALQSMDTTTTDAILLQAFNDFGRSMAIITYFKVRHLLTPVHPYANSSVQCLASAWIQSHPNDYLPFVPQYSDLKSYCAAHIDLAAAEIDHVAMAALGEVLVKPAGLCLEVLYLDRSPGEEINNTYRVGPPGLDEFALANTPTMRLLYRPYVIPLHLTLCIFF